MIVLLFVKSTGSGNVRALAPVIVIFSPMAMVPALAKIKFVKGAVPPMVPENVTVPVPAANVSAWAPLSVLLKVMAPF